MQKVCNNAYQQYVRSRPGASIERIKRIKELRVNEAGELYIKQKELEHCINIKILLIKNFYKI